jgi:hypothetical protein
MHKLSAATSSKTKSAQDSVGSSQRENGEAASPQSEEAQLEEDPASPQEDEGGTEFILNRLKAKYSLMMTSPTPASLYTSARTPSSHVATRDFGHASNPLSVSAATLRILRRRINTPQGSLGAGTTASTPAVASGGARKSAGNRYVSASETNTPLRSTFPRTLSPPDPSGAAKISRLKVSVPSSAGEHVGGGGGLTSLLRGRHGNGYTPLENGFGTAFRSPHSGYSHGLDPRHHQSRGHLSSPVVATSLGRGVRSPTHDLQELVYSLQHKVEALEGELRRRGGGDSGGIRAVQGPGDERVERGIEVPNLAAWLFLGMVYVLAGGLYASGEPVFLVANVALIAILSLKHIF